MSSPACAAAATPPAPGGPFIEGTLDMVDYNVAQFLCSSYTNITADDYLLTIWSGAATLAFAFLGYRFLFNGGGTAKEFAVAALKVVFIVALIKSASLYNFLFYNISTEFPAEIAGKLVVGDTSSGGLNSQLGDLIAASTKASEGLKVADRGLNSLTTVAWIIGMRIVVAILAAIVMLLVVLSKIGIAILLAIGPVILIGLLFDATKGWFEGWFKQLMTFALIPLFAYVILAFVISIMQAPLAIDPRSMRINEAVFQVAIPTIIVGIIAVLLFTQIQSIASQVAGGIALNTQAGVGKIGQAVAKRTQRAGATAGSAAKAGGMVAARSPVRFAKGMMQERAANPTPSHRQTRMGKAMDKVGSMASAVRRGGFSESAGRGATRAARRAHTATRNARAAELRAIRSKTIPK